MTKFTSIDAYIDSTEGTQRERLEVIRALFHRLVPDVEESISYNIPAFTVGRHHLYISSFAHHIGMYPIFDIPELEEAVAPYRGTGTKGSLHFKHTEPLPMDLVERIILAVAKI